MKIAASNFIYGGGLREWKSVKLLGHGNFVHRGGAETQRKANQETEEQNYRNYRDPSLDSGRKSDSNSYKQARVGISDGERF
jgi:hypothetical protein